jgi:23S rRNA pseudouridine955/2504/2580 synthase
VKEIIVTKIENPMRFDRYLRVVDHSLTQGVIEKALRSGLIKLNGAKAKSNVRIKNGDIVTIKLFLKDVEPNYTTKHFSQNIIALADKILGSYLIEDNEYFLAINKPSGLASQGGSKIDISIDHALQYLNMQGHDLRIVHRLDLETSGIFVIAKSRNATTLLGNALQNRLCEKRYLSWVKGDVVNDSGSVISYLAKAQDRMKEVSEGEGKLAITDYKVLRRKHGFTMLEFSPQTGRTHQLRCHAAMNLKCPIVGDMKYGIGTSGPLMLHAYEFFVPSVVFGVDYKVQAPVPEYFNLD